MKNFRNFASREISFWAWQNIIIWNNGRWKSNILEALSIPVNPMVESHPEYLVRTNCDTLYIWYSLSQESLSFSYTKSTKKRKYGLGWKSTTKQRIKSFYPHIVSFHPQAMNLMYLGPSERRSFLDELLGQAYEKYSTLLRNYKTILLSRNKILKNISDGKSSLSELDFWNQKFIASATEIYKYRKLFVEFLQENAFGLKKFLFWKVENIEFEYKTSIDLQDIEHSFSKALHELQSREILLRKTLRGPHLDDFDILLDWIPLIHFASRWEVKSILLWVKFLETQYLAENSSQKEIIFIIDDILSELDLQHRDMLLVHIGSRQSVISCIEDIGIEWNKIYI